MVDTEFSGYDFNDSARRILVYADRDEGHSAEHGTKGGFINMGLLCTFYTIFICIHAKFDLL